MYAEYIYIIKVKVYRVDFIEYQDAERLHVKLTETD